MVKLKEGYEVLPSNYRWKGREATWTTFGNYVGQYRKAVNEWVEAGKPEEGKPELARLSLKCDAVYLYLTEGRILKGFGMPLKIVPVQVVELTQDDDDQLTLAV